MELSSIIKPEAVKLVSTVSSKKRLMQDLGELAQAREIEKAHKPEVN